MPIISEAIGIFYALEKIENYEDAFEKKKELFVDSKILTKNKNNKTEQKSDSHSNLLVNEIDKVKSQVYLRKSSQKLSILNSKKLLSKLTSNLDQINIQNFSSEKNTFGKEPQDDGEPNQNRNAKAITSDFELINSKSQVSGNYNVIHENNNTPIHSHLPLEGKFNDCSQDSLNESFEIETKYFLDDFVNLYRLFYHEENWKMNMSLINDFPNTIKKASLFHSIRQNYRRIMFQYNKDNLLEAIMEYKKYKTLLTDLFEHFNLLMSDQIGEVRESAFRSLIPSLEILAELINFEDAELFDVHKVKLSKVISLRILSTLNFLVLHGETNVQVRGNYLFFLKVLYIYIYCFYLINAFVESLYIYICSLH